MPTTAQQIVHMAYAKSKRNVPGVQASESGELLPLLYRAMSGIYAISARVNRFFYAESVSVPYAAPGWPRPAQAEMVFAIEKADGSEVVVVPQDQQSAEPGLPSVFRWGQVFRPCNRPANVNGPTPADALTFLYSKTPDALPSFASNLDPMWPESYNELLALEVAIYMALKDGGQRAAEEVPPLRAQRDDWLRRYVAMLEHETVGERRSYGHVQVFNTNLLIPTSELLAGGSAVSLDRTA